MALGVLGSPRPVASLGYTSTINWWCWDQAGFKDCHAMAFSKAQLVCKGLPNDPDCVARETDAQAKAGCKCPATAPAGKKPPATFAPPPSYAPPTMQQSSAIPTSTGVSGQKTWLILAAAAVGIWYFTRDTKEKK